MVKENSIPVLDTENKFLSYTNPAKARILIDKGKARVFSKNPFMLKLKGDFEEEKMTDVKSYRSALVNFTKYFETEREVYVQNISNTQIALNFSMGPGADIPITIPKTRKPYNLTQYVPFLAIKNSTDLRKILTRRPPALKLMDEEEYMQYYENIARNNNTSMDEEVGKAHDLIEGIINKKVDTRPEALQREMQDLLQAKEEALSKPDRLHPQIIGLCAKADKDLGDDRISAQFFIEELEGLAPELSPEDWEFVQSKCGYKTVKSFALRMQEKLNPPTEDE